MIRTTGNIVSLGRPGRREVIRSRPETKRERFLRENARMREFSPAVADELLARWEAAGRGEE